jgi:hypothetical protein
MINFNCPCPKKGCSNHGNCETCKEYHTALNGEPFCERDHGFFTKILYRKNFKMVQKLRKEEKT